jgi:hypothetical protein
MEHGETRPLLADTATAQEPDVVLVEFDPAGDAENPMDWPLTYKWFIVSILALNAFMVYVVHPSYAHLVSQSLTHTLSHA